MDLPSLVALYRLAVGAFALIGLAVTIYLILTGLGLTFYRLGRGLSKRKIAVFAKADEQSTLASMLVSSNLFKNSRIVSITTPDGISAAESLDVFLVHWPDFQASINEIMNLKKDPTALIVYAPISGGRIPDDVMDKLNAKRNVSVCNMRGRLMSDIVLSMMTTGYEQK